MSNWCHLHPSVLNRLDHASLILREAFGDVPYLVGSCLERDDYEDIDVRVILDDDEFEGLFGWNGGTTSNGSRNGLWSLVTTAVSEYLTGIVGGDQPVDFQIQARSRVSDDDWKKPRHPLGIFPVRWIGTRKDAGK